MRSGSNDLVKASTQVVFSTLLAVAKEEEEEKRNKLRDEIE